MSMKRCVNGHFYDSDKYRQCPYCGISDSAASRTMPIIDTNPNPNTQPIGKTISMAPEQAHSGEVRISDDQKTVGIMQKNTGIDPVVGWVVCIDGPSKGRDYRIRSERNFIGRGSSMDIVLSEDTSVSRECHAIISYNPKNGTFKLIPGEGHGIVYKNDDEVLLPVDLNAGDIIEIGRTKLRFVPFCDGVFTW